MLSLESPHRGDSNEYTQYTIFNIKKKITLNYSKSTAMDFYSKGLKNKIETAVVNEPSVFEPPKFYCISTYAALILTIFSIKYFHDLINVSLFQDTEYLLQKWIPARIV